MADPRFFTNAGPFTLAELAEICGAEIEAPDNAGSIDTMRSVQDVKPLSVATAEDLSFIDNKKYIPEFEQTTAGTILVHPDLVEKAPSTAVCLVHRDPYRSYAKAAQAFYPRPTVTGSRHALAAIDPTATVAGDCRIDAGAVIEAGAIIGSGSHIGPNAVISAGVEIGAGCWIGPCSSVANALVEDRVIIHAGVRIGQDGFGFAPGADGHLKVPQLGRVLVGHDVEIGANTTIDRGTGPDTIIGAGSKIDNLVQIAHNVRLGKGCIVVSQVGISGSTEVGDFVMIGGQAGLTGHLTIGSGAKVAAQSGVMRDIEPGATVGGSPARPMREWLKETAMITRLARQQSKR